MSISTLLLMSATSTALPANAVLVFSFFAQSNGAGPLFNPADFTSIPEYLGEQDNIYCAQYATRSPATGFEMQKNHIEVNCLNSLSATFGTANFGWEQSLAHDIQAHFNRTVYYDKEALGGQSEVEWMPGGYWYDIIDRVYTDEAAYFAANGLTPFWLPLFVDQGEATATQAGWESIIDDVRARVPGRAVVFMLRTTAQYNEYPNGNAAQKAIAGSANGGTGTATRPNVWCLDLSGMDGITTVGSDAPGTHYPPAVQLLRGHYMFDFCVANDLL